jgi:hypothetical protein
MSAVPVILNGVMYPKSKSGRGRSADDEPVPAVFIGYLSIQGLEVGGGPIIPDNPPPDGAHPEHPIVLPPDAPVVPPDPSPPDPGPNVVVVVKPAPVTGGWGLATDASGSVKWFFTPSESGTGPGPKR